MVLSVGTIKRSGGRRRTVRSCFLWGLNEKEYADYAFLAREILYQSKADPSLIGGFLYGLYDIVSDLLITETACDAEGPGRLSCKAGAGGLCGSCYGKDLS